MRLLVTGSRNWTDSDTIRTAIAKAIGDHPYSKKLGEIVIVHGDSPGADQIAKLWALSLDGIMTQEAHPADWATHGKAAGPIRNQEMVDAGADVCLAFPLGESRGTRDCMRRAETAGIPVINYEDNNLGFA